MASSACNHGQDWCWGCLSHTGVAFLGRATRWRRREAAGVSSLVGAASESRWKGCVCGRRGTATLEALRHEMASLETRALSGKLRTAF